jgi:hypothetical protein
MIRRVRRWVTLVVVMAMTPSLAGCGGGASVPRLRPNGPITRAEAIAVADAVNMRHGDAPSLASKVSPRRLRPPAFVRCGGPINPSLRLAEVASHLFETGNRSISTLTFSNVVVWPTATITERARDFAESARGIACYEHALSEGRTERRPDGVVVHRPRTHVERLPDPIIGVPSVAFQAARTYVGTVAGAPTHGIYEVPIYIDIMQAQVAPIVVTVQVQTINRKPPLALEQKLLERLYARARERVA